MKAIKAIDACRLKAREFWANERRESQERYAALFARAEEFDLTEAELEAAKDEPLPPELEANLEQIWLKHNAA